MILFLRFYLPMLLVLIFSGPVVPYLWKKERVSSIVLSLLILMTIGLASLVLIEYMTWNSTLPW
ncbi:hypothetical protein [Ferroacidibacillus organovorans]|uniref:Uncharacterized protein n=1 Tax=Ferroacidibacillus organovorans TaxID=1765683 RepID=A0A101XTU5_9BACL|nr:hypothetical protein [Ferroacidibacillus organovorans]KUO97425.1 hypothetical protein ATW55_06050 [Ferroacidibacillus organovorans]